MWGAAVGDFLLRAKSMRRDMDAGGKSGGGGEGTSSSAGVAAATISPTAAPQPSPQQEQQQQQQSHRLLVAACDYGMVYVYNITPLLPSSVPAASFSSLEFPVVAIFRAHNAPITRLSFLPNSRLIVTMSTLDCYVKTFELQGTMLGHFGQRMPYWYKRPETFQIILRCQWKTTNILSRRSRYLGDAGRQLCSVAVHRHPATTGNRDLDVEGPWWPPCDAASVHDADDHAVASTARHTRGVPTAGGRVNCAGAFGRGRVRVEHTSTGTCSCCRHIANHTTLSLVGAIPPQRLLPLLPDGRYPSWN